MSSIAGMVCTGTQTLDTLFTEAGNVAHLGPYTICADARIDGRADLLARFEPECRKELKQAGDAQLLLACYQRWGAGLLKYAIGDFSFAIWDAAEQRLLCARDHFGVKPFFYRQAPGALQFSNRIDCLSGGAQDLDRLAISDFLLFGRYLDPGATAFSEIRRLPAGHSLEWQDGRITLRRYWNLPVGEAVRFARETEYIEGFQHYAAQAVRDRLHPDRTAVLMSGGLDSTMVATVASEYGQAKSFAIVYDRLIPDPERRYAQLAADAIGIPLDCLPADDYGLFQPNRITPEPVDEPVPAVFTDHLSRVRDYSSVALTGVGGDQILFPSPNFAVGLLRSGQLGELAGGLCQFMRLRHRIPPVGFRSGILRAFGVQREPDAQIPPWMNPGLVQELDLTNRWNSAQQELKDSPHANRPEAYAQLMDPAWSGILESYDAGTTKIPLEVRHPLFDLRLVQYCLALPPIPWFVDKTLARAAMRDRLPDEVRLRPKSFAADAVAPRLAGTTTWDSWTPATKLTQFVDRSRVPTLSAVADAWDPHHRPFLLNRWLFQLTQI